MQEQIGLVRFEQVTTLTIGCRGLDAGSHSHAMRIGRYGEGRVDNHAHREPLRSFVFKILPHGNESMW